MAFDVNPVPLSLTIMPVEPTELLVIDPDPNLVAKAFKLHFNPQRASRGYLFWFLERYEV
jgi:hypothetical protein